MDKRSNRVQPVRLDSEFFPLDIHKSMFINDLQITIPKYYAEKWGDDILSSHDENNRSWDIDIEYHSPRDLGSKKSKHKAKLYLSFIKKRSKASSYRLKWDNEFAIRLAKDYPKSFVRSLEFHIGDEYYKELKYAEFDIGGFKEQLQVKIDWKSSKPKVVIKEFFSIKPELQGFPKVFEQLSSYLIADYLLSSEQKMLRSISVTKWRKKSELSKELNENNIYLLLNRSKKQIYFGETKKSLSKRYPSNQDHHSFPDWQEYSIMHLPPETTDATRLLIERVLISVGCKLFPNIISKETPVIEEKVALELVNKKK